MVFRLWADPVIMNDERWEHTWKSAIDGKTDGQDSHQRLVRHRVNDGSHDCLELPAPCDIPVEQVRNTGICKQSKGPGMVVVKDQVPNGRGSDEPGDGQDIGKRVDVLVRSDSQGLEKAFLSRSGRSRSTRTRRRSAIDHNAAHSLLMVDDDRTDESAHGRNPGIMTTM